MRMGFYIKTNFEFLGRKTIILGEIHKLKLNMGHVKKYLVLSFFLNFISFVKK